MNNLKHAIIPLTFAIFLATHWAPVFAQRGPATVAVAKVVASDQVSGKTFLGTVTPINNSVIGSAVDGRVEKVFVDAGDRVLKSGSSDAVIAKMGQPLLQLRTGTLQIEIDTAHIVLKNRLNALKEMQTALPIDIEQAKATVAEGEARLKYAKSKYERMERLYKSGGGSTQNERDESFSIYRSAEENLKAAQSALKKLSDTQEIRILQLQSLVDSQKAEIRRLEDLRGKYTIRAPFDGYVVSRMANVGQWISRGEDVFQVVQLDPIEVTVNVPQSSIHNLQKTLDGYKKRNEKLFAQVLVESSNDLIQGEVVRIVPQADLRSRSFPVKVKIKNPETATGHAVKSGMLTKVTLSIGEKKKNLFVKKDALVLGSDDIKIFVVSKDDKDQATVRPVSVQIGATLNDWIEVRGSVAENELVVIEGNERLRPGQEVVITNQSSEKFPEQTQTESPQTPQ